VREDEQVLLDGERHVQVVELRRDAELRSGLLRLLRQLEPEHLDLALVGDRLARQRAHRRRLAGPVRPEQADARRHGDVEVEPGDRGDLVVALDDPTQADGQLAAHAASVRAGRLHPRVNAGPAPWIPPLASIV
jgi:hypothetical protein